MTGRKPFGFNTDRSPPTEKDLGAGVPIREVSEAELLGALIIRTEMTLEGRIAQRIKKTRASPRIHSGSVFRDRER